MLNIDRYFDPQSFLKIYDYHIHLLFLLALYLEKLAEKMPVFLYLNIFFH